MKLFLNENDDKTNSEVFETKPFPKGNQMWTSDDTEKAARVKIGNLGIIRFLSVSECSLSFQETKFNIKWRSRWTFEKLYLTIDLVLVWIKFRKRKSDKRGLQLSHKSFCSKLSRLIDKIRIYVVFWRFFLNIRFLYRLPTRYQIPCLLKLFTKSTKTTKFIPHNQWL